MKTIIYIQINDYYKIKICNYFKDNVMYIYIYNIKKYINNALRYINLNIYDMSNKSYFVKRWKPKSIKLDIAHIAIYWRETKIGQKP